ncbi:MAG: nucleotidyltransferase family protein, partial [Dehalococcoidales bacterium]|nr:nucleotidyltransferase family protein [Dehalococcoidales bacterium]
MSVSAVLLAAGQSTRMGQNKALLAWKGQTMLEYHLDQLRQTSIEKTVVVLGFEAERLQPLVAETAKASVIINADYLSGRCSSIKAGIRVLPPQSDSVLILAIDQPRPYYLLEALIKYHQKRRHLITMPVYQGRRGHPTLFARSLFAELLEISEETAGLLQVVRRHQKK